MVQSASRNADPGVLLAKREIDEDARFRRPAATGGSTQLEHSSPGPISEERLIQIAMEFNAAWNAGDADAVLAFFTPDAVVRIVPPPPPPEPERFTGHEEIRGWIDRTLALPFTVNATNYRAACSVVTWDAAFPNEGPDSSPDVSEAVFRGSLISDFTP